MTQLAAFTAQEQSLLGNAPLAAAAAVAIADEGGGAREANALLAAWREAHTHVQGHELVDAIIAELDPMSRPTQELAGTDAPPTAELMRAEAVTLCRQAVQLLEEKATPDEADAYKRFVLHIATQVAQAATSNSVFGFGGVPVSIEEQVALRAIRVALAYTPPDLSL